ncbi:PilW family protein [Rhodanobacter fulvus]|nr:PilW family protein [Rhodanobacter fulvus]
MSAHARHVSRSRQIGVSLIELMVAMLLGAIVVAGLIQILTANRKAYQLQESNNFQQQNLRFATDRIDWSIRMADFWGGLRAADVTGLLGDGGGATGCDDTWLVAGKPGSGAGGLYGYDGAAVFPIASCALVPNSDYVPGTDVLVVRYADTDPCAVPDGNTAALSATTLSTCLPSSSYFLAASVGQGAQLFKLADSIPLTGDTQRYVYPYRVEAYYLQPCSDRPAAGCNAMSDGGTPRPTLMRLRLTESGLVREPLVEGIEQLQLEYGVSTDGTHVNQFKNATKVTAAEWPTVLAVRVTLLARSPDRDVSVSHAGTFKVSEKCSYTISNAGAVTLATTDSDCTGFSLGGLARPNQFSRSMQQQIVQIRNRVRG